jgi:hypothetical protein
MKWWNFTEIEIEKWQLFIPGYTFGYEFVIHIRSLDYKTSEKLSGCL